MNHENQDTQARIESMERAMHTAALLIGGLCFVAVLGFGALL